MPLTVRAALLPMLALALAMPAAAQDSNSASKKRKPLDPNETVCKTEDVLGSRLAKRRTCMTRAQWAERQHNDRELVEKTQTQQCTAMGGTCGAN
ncbi:hypothetical protein [Sphingomonas sp.]|uniref:hypothetical protein n=1 Tax=Sphingomonas sp. TaxID=28214 RepID=UPI001B205D0B|nr:hypothetical protein [Sphingomonas sp.]MBO9713128.1 hypothetical protein [Sphingomonas sp.]